MTENTPETPAEDMQPVDGEFGEPDTTPAEQGDDAAVDENGDELADDADTDA